jgi:hypothetical protein
MMLQYAFLEHCDDNFCCFSMIGFCIILVLGVIS